MTDAGEKLRGRLVTIWAALPSKAEHPEVITYVEFTVMCVRAELERAAGIAENAKSDASANEYVLGYEDAAEDIASAIRKLKE